MSAASLASQEAPTTWWLPIGLHLIMLLMHVKMHAAGMVCLADAALAQELQMLCVFLQGPYLLAWLCMCYCKAYERHAVDQLAFQERIFVGKC